ncbi:MAG TPA: carbon starvation protein A [Desulfurobacteriaceae bacterium]|nr:carbon starvation protein A [Desulfurobacteriaceae bacterium]
MTTTLLILLGVAIYSILYFSYGRFLEKKVLEASKDRLTPAHKLRDDVDFVPANKYVLFGHHFASIAGAGPILGPVFALVWGWLPTILWIWLGNAFIGAVHDYVSLMSSVRYDGKSIQWIAGKLIRKRTGYLFSLFILFALILVVAAFASVIAKIFTAKPATASAYVITIIEAVILGYLMYKRQINFKLASVLAIIFLIISVVLSFYIPIKLSYQVWLVIFLFYIIIASSLPVWVLLQPRDYLNAWLLLAGLVLGGLSLVIINKFFVAPAFTTFSPPLIAGQPTPLWPAIVLIVACGSLSGFHSLVASGTTSKQLSSEEEGLFIGYGAMFTEGFLSTLVVASLAAYAPIIIKGLSMSPQEFSQAYIKAMKASGGPVGVFSKAYAHAAHEAFSFLSVKAVAVFAAMWVASFAMTTLDTTNRLARYVFVEILEPFKDTLGKLYNILSNRWVASLVPALFGIWLAWSKAYTVIWPAFSGANQMLASIALLTIAAYVTRVLRKRAWYITYPAYILWVTVTIALIWYLVKIVPVFGVKNPTQATALGIMTLVMILLNFVLMYDYLKGKKDKVIENV